MTNPTSDEMIERLQRGVTYREERWPGNDGSSRFPNISEANEIMKEAAIRIRRDAKTIKRMDDALVRLVGAAESMAYIENSGLADEAIEQARAARSSLDETRKEPS